MIYDTTGLEEHYDTTMSGINEILHELDANHDHIDPKDILDIDRAYALLRKVQRHHERKLKKWEETNS